MKTTKINPVEIETKIVDAQGNELVPVVRCKDCKYLNIINKAPVYACCSKHNHTFYLWEEDTRNHFCSWSERKEDTETVKYVKHGHWDKPQIHGVMVYDEHAYAECSCCHKPQYFGRGMNYCPNCGAKMDEVKDAD